MATCLKCGRENPAGMRFCTNCGEAIPETPGGTSSDAINPSSFETLSFNTRPQTAPTNWPNLGEAFNQPAPPVSEAKKSKTGLIIGIVSAVLLLGLIVIGAGVGFYYYSQPDTGTANGNNNEGVANPLDDEADANSNNANADSSPSPKASPTPAPSPSPKLAFEPPTEPTRDGSFTVYANEDWQLSSIAVVPNEEFTTTVEGIVDLANAKAGIRAGGTSDAKYKERRLFPEWPTGALLMRTRYADGRFSNTVAVAAGTANGSWKNLPDERGMLEFRLNDKMPQGNGGQFTIRVKLTKVPKN